MSRSGRCNSRLQISVQQSGRATRRPIKTSRGQVSPFLILSLLIVLSVGLLYYSGNLQRLFGPLRVAYPVEVEPVAHFIQDCARDTGTEAAIAVASQGGYITLPQEIQREYDAFLPLDDLNLKILPFWSHRGRSRVPTINSIERQISDFVTNRTIACLDNFRSLGDRYIITELGNLTTTATLTGESVYISIDYPLKVIPRATLKETRMQEFSSAVPARLKTMHELATAIMTFQDKHLAIENLTLDLMSSDPEIPLNHLGVECKSERWDLQDIQTRLAELISTNLLTVRIKNTDHVPFEADDATYQSLGEAHQKIQAALEEGEESFDAMPFIPRSAPNDSFEYFHTFWDVGAPKTPMTVAVTYQPDYGMDLSATPSANGHLSSTVYKGSRAFLGFLCLHTYHFTYTIRYPVRVSIHDPLSFGGKGLTYEFAIPISISNNEPEPRKSARRFISDIRPPEGFCAKYGTTFYEIRAIGSDEDGFISNAGLDSVNISYRCAGRLCDLGATGAISGNYALITPMPEGCKNPSIIANKEGYLKNEQFLDEKLTLIPLTKLKTIPVTITKKPYFVLDKKTGETEPLASDENVTLLIQSLGSEGFTQNIGLPAKNPTITLIEGKADYLIDAVLTKGDRIIGGYHMGNLTIDGRDVARSTDMEITVIDYRPTPLTDADESTMALYLMTGDYQKPLRPKLS